MIARVAWLVVGGLAAVLLITLAVINRQVVPLLVPDPFDPQRPLAVELPFYVYLFAMLFVGIVLGGLTTWTAQGKWRRIARNRIREAARWRGEAERLVHERDTELLQSGTTQRPPSEGKLAYSRS